MTRGRLQLVVALFFFASGSCALVYQSVWLKTFRSIFGASTPATAAVLAVFMGGLGLGAIKLGRSGQQAPNPLRLYALLELGIAFTAAMSPLILDLVSFVYLGLGGSSSLGSAGATVLRLALAPLVIGVPVFLMGGTLPVAARVVTVSTDVGRLRLAALYGMNALGAVCGVVLSTFFLFEAFGFSTTLYYACALNALVGVLAWRLSADAESVPSERPTATAPTQAPRPIPQRWVLLAAFATGFCFLLAELVWYRMGAPILGGSTYTFGLILAFALGGIGAGGLLYARFGPERPTPGRFGVTCALQAVVLIAPFVLGDNLAHLAFQLRGLSNLGFAGLVCGWSVVTAILVLPAALVAGYQFPMLLALVGRGREDVSVEVGRVYAANTVGSILGSLAGGFGLLPLLTAPRAWQLAAVVLLAAGAPFVRRRSDRLARAVFVLFACAVGVSLFATGPTAFWRHGGIGAGRSSLPRTTSWNERREAELERERDLLSEWEGVENALGVFNTNGLAFYLDGKSDGDVVGDAPTTVFLGMIGGLIHPNPERAFVVGLGGGQTAGWLAEIPTMKSVRVAELEPGVLKFADLCKQANFDVLAHPKVEIVVADGRELLKTSSEQYDLITSEPSNPFRKGVASFYTVDYYQETRARLRPGGIFMQWFQCYEVDAEAVRLCLATLRSVYPSVTVWITGLGDLLLLASDGPLLLDIEGIRVRLAQEPFRSAFGRVGGVYDVEGFLARFVAGDGLAQRALERVGPHGLNSGDHPLLEYRFARSVGSSVGVHPHSLLTPAQALGAGRPWVDGSVDWDRADLLRARIYQVEGFELPKMVVRGPATVQVLFWNLIYRRQFTRAAQVLAKMGPPPPHDLYERMLRIEARCLSENAWNSTQEQLLEQELKALAGQGLATEVAWIRLERALYDETRHDSILALAGEAFTLARAEAGLSLQLVRRTLRLAAAHVSDPAIAKPLARLLAEGPFAVYLGEFIRRRVAVSLAGRSGDFATVAKVLQAMEPHPLWTSKDLERRAKAYAAEMPALEAAAKADLREFRLREGDTIDELLGTEQAQ